MLKLSSETLFIHPLPTYLAKRAVPGDEKATPHLIYRKSLQVQIDAKTAKRGMTHIFSCLISLVLLQVLLLEQCTSKGSFVATDERFFLCIYINSGQ